MPSAFHTVSFRAFCIGAAALAAAGIARAAIPGQGPSPPTNPRAAVLVFTQQIESGNLTGQALADAYAGRCRARAALREAAGALEDCSQSIATLDNAAARVMRGALYVQQKNPTSALVDFAAITRLQPRNPLGHALRAGVYWQENDLGNFAAESDAVIALSANPQDARKQRAEQYFRAGYWARAKTDYDAILRQDPDSAEFTRFRGDVRVFTGDFDGGMADYARALTLDPKGQARNVALSRTLAWFDRKDYAQAMEHARIAADAAPADPYPLLWLGVTASHAGKFDAQDFAKRSAAIEKLVWPWPVIAHRMGQASEDDVWAASTVGMGQQQLTMQKCEAQFYIAQSKLASDKDRAISLLKQVADTCIKGMIEYNGAVFELRALGETVTFGVDAN